jgi:hypothetical protein
LEWFADAFNRFCTSSSAPDPDSIRNTATDLFSKDFSPFPSATSQNDVADKNDEKPFDINHVADVADKNRGGAEKKGIAPASTTKLKSDDLPYDGPPVAVPNLGPDDRDEHGYPLAGNGSTEPGLSRRRIRELAGQYQDRAYANAHETGGDTRTAECDAWLRAILREEVDLPEHVEIEFERVMQVVFP